MSEAVVTPAVSSSQPGWPSVAIFAGLGILLLYERITREEELDPYSTEGAKELYATNEITQEEFIRRMEVAESPEYDKIRNIAESFNQVGEQTSYAIAQHFETVREFETASQEELEEIHGIGPSLSSEMRRRFDG